MLENECKVVPGDFVDDIEPESLITFDSDGVRLFNEDLVKHEIWKLESLETKSSSMLLKLIFQLKKVSYSEEEVMNSRINSILLEKERK